MKFPVLSCICLCCCLAIIPEPNWAGEKGAKVVTINIVGKGSKAKFIKQGETTEEQVVVYVGQTVRWQNKGNVEHTATSKLMVGGKPLFDTGLLDAGEAKEIQFDEKLFKSAGGKVGSQISLDYICTPHKALMKSVIVLKSKDDSK
jgi:plastocyanin